MFRYSNVGAFSSKFDTISKAVTEKEKKHNKHTVAEFVPYIFLITADYKITLALITPSIAAMALSAFSGTSFTSRIVYATDFLPAFTMCSMFTPLEDSAEVIFAIISGMFL